MPKRSDQGGARLPNLVVPRGEASERLLVQVKQGRGIHDRKISSKDDLRKLRGERTKWSDFTREMLLRIFDSSSFADEFQLGHASVGFLGATTLGFEIDEFRRETAHALTKLESILARIELVPEQVPGRGRELRSATMFDSFHPEVQAVSERLFFDGHHAQAIFEAYKAVNAKVKALVPGIDLDGKKLMAHVFRPEAPVLTLHEASASQSGRDEQEGFMLIFMGAMQGVRNPKAHDLIVQESPERTLEYLALASLLMRRIDDAILLRTRRA